MTYYIKNMPQMSVFLQNLAFKNGYIWKSGSVEPKLSKCTYMGVDPKTKQIWNSNEKHEGISLEEGIERLVQKEITLKWSELQENVLYEVCDGGSYNMKGAVIIRSYQAGSWPDQCTVLQGKEIQLGRWCGYAWKDWTYKKFEGTVTLGAE